MTLWSREQRDEPAAGVVPSPLSMTAEATVPPAPALAPYPPAVKAVAAILARARIDDMHAALEAWPRCAQCNRFFPPRRVVRADHPGALARCCCSRCVKKHAANRWRRKKRLREREARAIAAELAPQESLATRAPEKRLPPPTPQTVKVYHAGREPLWTIEPVSAPARARKR